MDKTVPLRDQLVSLEGVVHWEERGEWGDDVEGGRTLCFVQDLEQLKLAVAGESTWTLKSTGGPSAGH